MKLTEEQLSGISATIQTSLEAAVQSAAKHSIDSISNDWRMQDQIKEAVRTRFSALVSEVIAEKLKDRKLVEKLVTDRLMNSITNRLTKQLKALDNSKP